MPQVSVSVTHEQYEKKNNLHLKWSTLIYQGLRFSDEEMKRKLVENQVEELIAENRILKSESQRKGVKLSKYIEKYGVDEEIMYKYKEE